MKLVIMLRGLPACGKSTWARAFQRKHRGTHIISKDSLRPGSSGELDVIRKRNETLAALLGMRQVRKVIIDDTNLNPAHRKSIETICRGRAVLTEKFFNVPVRECIERNKNRPNRVPDAAIYSMNAKYLK